MSGSELFDAVLRNLPLFTACVAALGIPVSNVVQAVLTRRTRAMELYLGMQHKAYSDLLNAMSVDWSDTPGKTFTDFDRAFSRATETAVLVSTRECGTIIGCFASEYRVFMHEWFAGKENVNYTKIVESYLDLLHLALSEEMLRFDPTRRKRSWALRFSAYRVRKWRQGQVSRLKSRVEMLKSNARSTLDSKHNHRGDAGKSRQ